MFVEFEGVYMNAEVWLNEHYIGRHPFGYTSFQVDLSDFLRIGEENTLKVQVDNAAEPNSRWYSGSGIYRPVWLMVAEPLHLAQWGVYVTTPEVTAQAASVRVQTSLENESEAAQEVTLRSRILGPDGQPAASAEAHASVAAGRKHKFNQELKVRAPSLWSVDTPVLYTLESEVYAGGKLVDSAVTTFGIRTIEFDAVNGFRLNGQKLKIKGGCVHHDNGVLGATLYPRAEERKVEIHKASGYNAIRCAHNPPSPAFLDACDRLGMLVIDEAFDCWRDGKNPYDYHVAFDDWWQRDLDSMLLRDRNHPCVFLWSIGNEVMERDGRSKGAEIARMLAERVREVDPTRPVTAAICGVWDQDGRHKWEDTDVVFAALDVGGYNYQWKQYHPDHERHPQRMMIGLESTPGEALDNWTLVEKESYVLGDFVWTSLDYLGEAGIGRVVYGDKEARVPGRLPLAPGQLRRPGPVRFQAPAVLLPRPALGRWHAALYRRALPIPRRDARQDDILGLAGSLAKLDLAWKRGADLQGGRLLGLRVGRTVPQRALAGRPADHTRRAPDRQLRGAIRGRRTEGSWIQGRQSSG